MELPCSKDSFISSMLAEKLNMTPEEAERWIVNLIRNARLDAKIDSKLVRVFLKTLFGFTRIQCVVAEIHASIMKTIS